ncbi:hypothetical protein [Paenibacillus ginsengihumi]|uniref:hypothetical protein n=1 Tax=Paenibacillus ginsengihumi TaxID=431596 RepID=UPI000381A3C7|nr:hypothetical protein [Paenibacillus ginsengihumi]
MEGDGNKQYVFNVDIMIEDATNGRALEKLLHLLNTETVFDYRINGGIELGKRVENALKDSVHKPVSIAAPKPAASPVKPEEPTPEKPLAAEPQAPALTEDPIWEEFRSFQRSNTLLRITVVKEKGGRISIPCRVLHADPASGNVSVYHVDEKSVYLLHIAEIDDVEIRG